MPEKDIIVGLDVGTSRISVLIAEYDEAGELCFAGAAALPSKGLTKGIIVNIESAQKLIASVIEAAEQEAGRTVQSVHTAVTEGSAEGRNLRGILAVSGKNREVTDQDISRVIEAARAVQVPLDREVLHVLPRHFTVDDKTGIRDPKNMIGVRLEVEVHMVTGSIASIHNLNSCILRSGYKVDELSLASLAASRAVLSEEEKEMGVLYLDIGGGTTDALAIVGGAPCFSMSLPVAGELVTSDLSIVLEQSMEQAEGIKCQEAKCWEPLANPERMVLLPGLGGHPPRNVPEMEVCRIVQSRILETLLLVRNQLHRKGFLNSLKSGVVLGGGSAHLSGILDLAGEIFKRPARLAHPSGLKNLPSFCREPEWATVLGLVLRAADGKAEFAGKGNTTKGSLSLSDKLKAWLGNFI